MPSSKLTTTVVPIDPPTVFYKSSGVDPSLLSSLVAAGPPAAPPGLAASSKAQAALASAGTADVDASAAVSAAGDPLTAATRPAALLGMGAAAPASAAATTTTSSAASTSTSSTTTSTLTGSPTTTSSGSDPVIAASLATKGQGSGKTNLPPPPPPTPTIVSRGQEAWTAERVAALISAGTISADMLPDVRATAPTNMQIMNEHQREMLRFTNCIANTGANNWQVHRGVPLTDQTQIDYAVSLGLDPSQLAITSQELLDKNGNIAAVIPDAALSEYHPAHKHFHIGETAEFEVDKYNEASKTWDIITGLNVVKTTFCLIDVNQIQKVADADPDHYDIVKSPANQNVYNDCFADVQGVQAGWLDRYHHELPGQEVDVTNLPAGTYRIFTTVNPAGWFMESDFSNNTGYTAFNIDRDSNGNAKLRVLPDHGGLWFDNASNGMG